MLTENHTRCTYAPAKKNAKRYPIDSIKVTNIRKGEEHADNTSRCCGMGGYFYPLVDNGTDDLYHQSGRYYGRDEVGHIETCQHDEQEGVAHDTDDVRCVTSVAQTHFLAAPTVMLTIGVNDGAGKEYGEDENHEHQLKMEPKRHGSQVGEG